VKRDHHHQQRRQKRQHYGRSRATSTGLLFGWSRLARARPAGQSAGPSLTHNTTGQRRRSLKSGRGLHASSIGGRDQVPHRPPPESIYQFEACARLIVVCSSELGANQLSSSSSYSPSLAFTLYPPARPIRLIGERRRLAPFSGAQCPPKVV
jgi:hypothetical protein